MKPPKKWEPGPERIVTFIAFDDALIANRVVFVKRYFSGRAVSMKVLSQMSYECVSRMIFAGSITIGVERDEYTEWLREELLGKDKT